MTVPRINPCYHAVSLAALQRQQQAWARRQPWPQGDGTLAFIGMIEELGEMADAIGYVPDSDPEVVRAILLMSHLGKFAHATLKHAQQIRLNENHRANARQALEDLVDIARPHGGLEDAFNATVEQGCPTDEAKLADGAGDLVIYAFDVFNNKGLVLEDAIAETCNEVFSRDWKKHPTNGKTA